MVLHIDENGVIRVAGTRIPIEIIVQAYWDGETAESISIHFPSLTPEVVEQVIDYYLAHREEIDQYCAERKRIAQQIREEVEAMYPPITREQLLARRAKRNTG